jgi:hypothetical protein
LRLAYGQLFAQTFVFGQALDKNKVNMEIKIKKRKFLANYSKEKAIGQGV